MGCFLSALLGENTLFVHTVLERANLLSFTAFLNMAGLLDMPWNGVEKWSKTDIILTCWYSQSTLKNKKNYHISINPDIWWVPGSLSSYPLCCLKLVFRVEWLRKWSALYWDGLDMKECKRGEFTKVYGNGITEPGVSGRGGPFQARRKYLSISWRLFCYSQPFRMEHVGGKDLS